MNLSYETLNMLLNGWIDTSQFELRVLTQPVIYCSPHQGDREKLRVPQFVMLCRRWAQLQCFAGRTGPTHGTTAIVLPENAHNTATSGLLKKN